MSSIDFIAPAAKTLTVEGVEVVITPLRVKELPALVRLVDPLLAQLIYDAGGLDVPRMIALLGDHGEAIIDATAICIRQPRAWLDELLPDRLAVLALLAIEVNADFFMRALAALQVSVRELAPGLAQRINAADASATAPA